MAKAKTPSAPVISPASEPKGRGRPPKLVADEATLKTIKGLGNILATTKECAAVLEVDEKTFLKFLADHPEANTLLEHGQGQRLASVRRKQLEVADKGNIVALIWVGKQYLGQRDKSDVAVDARVEMGGAFASLAAKLARELGEDAAPGADEGA